MRKTFRGRKYQDLTKILTLTKVLRLEHFETYELPPGAYEINDIYYSPEQILYRIVKNKVEMVRCQ